MEPDHKHNWVNFYIARFSEYETVIFWCDICGALCKEKWVDNRRIYEWPTVTPINELKRMQRSN